MKAKPNNDYYFFAQFLNGAEKLRREMRKILFFSTLLVASFFMASLGLYAVSHATVDQESEVYEITFSSKDLSFSKLDGYDVVNLKDCIFTRFVGSPQLPYKAVHLVIPEGKEVSDIRIIEDLIEEIPGEYNIYPAQKSQKYGEESEFTLPNLEVYGSSEYFPIEIIKESVQGSLSGIDISSIPIYPLQYLPLQKKLLLHKRITFQLTYTDKPLPELRVDQTKRTARGIDTIKRFSKKVVFSPKEVDTFFEKALSYEDSLQKGAAAPSGGDSVDYLIITSDELIASGVFQPLLESRESKGFRTKIESASRIETNYLGRDTQEKIRNYIKELYVNNGLIYVLLGGDTNIVPPRYTYFQDYTEETGDTYLPTDMYYSDLDHSWDGNNNNQFGEPEDDVDLYPDVFVGRAPVEDQAEAAVFVEKIIAFESKSFVDYGDDKALFIGGNDFDDSGGKTKDLIDVRYMSSAFNPITKLYERDFMSSSSNVFSALNDGYYLVNHINHGRIDRLYAAYKDYIGINNDPDAGQLIDNLTNGLDGLYSSFMWSCACFSAAIDYDCIAEHWITNPHGGGVAFVGHTRFGFWPESDTMLDPEFFKSLFSEEIYHIGETLADSKVTFIPATSNIAGGRSMRYVLYTLSLLGDPALEIYSGGGDGSSILVPQDYPTIQLAIDASSDGDIILVSPGIYAPINFNGKVITIKSTDGPQTTIIDGGGEQSVVTFSSRETEASVLEGVTIQNGAAERGGGVYYSNFSSGTLTHNIIRNNTASSVGGGIYCEEGSGPTIKNTLIFENEAEAGGGIFCTESTLNIDQSTITENTADYGGGVCGDFPPYGGLTITNSIVWGNNFDPICTQGCCYNSPILSFSNLEWPLTNYFDLHQNFWSQNISIDPLFIDPDYENFHLQFGSPCVDTGSPYSDYSLEPEPNGNRVNMGAYGNTPEATKTEPDINHAPTLYTIGNKDVDEGELLKFVVSGSDPDGDDLIYSASGLPQGASFDVNIHIFSWTSWTPTSSQIGIHSVTFTVTDPSGASDSETIIIIVTGDDKPEPLPEPPTCFLASTPIPMADGSSKPIEKVKVGDKVLAFDANTGAFREDKVIEFFEHEADEYLIINGNLKVTENHPVYSDGVWRKVGALNIGDKLFNSKGEREEITSIEEVKKKVKVYNLEVNPLHTYIAGGFVVHNKLAPRPPERLP